jgi:gliding motility-associated-like protein
MQRKYFLLICFFSLQVYTKALNGDFLWAKAFGGSNNDFGYSITTDVYGNSYVTGYLYDSADFDPGPGVYELKSAGYYDIFITKLDPSGNFIWARSMGGEMFDVGHSIAVDKGGNVFITGYFNETVDFDPGPGIYNLTSVTGCSAIFLCRLDHAGNFVWAKNVNGWGNHNMGYSIALDEYSNVYFTGMFDGKPDFDPGSGVSILASQGWRDTFVCKFNSSGIFIWGKSFGYSNMWGGDMGRSIKVDALNNVYITGTYSGPVDFDPGPGVYNSSPIGGNFDMFILKLSSSGNFIWMRSVGGIKHESPNSIAIDNSGNVYTTGWFYSSSDFDPGSGVYNLTSPGWNIFISKLDPFGNFVWAKQLGSGKESSEAIDVDAEGNVYTTGTFKDTIDFDPGPGVYDLVSPGKYSGYIAKFDTDGVLVWVKNYGGKGRSLKIERSAIFLTGEFNDTVDLNPDEGNESFISKGSSDVYVIKLENEADEINASAPNVFTPNNDGINDLFVIPDIIPGSTISFYDRWGIKVFEPSAEVILNSGWDGRTSAGIECSSGVYYYLVEQPKGKKIKGFVHLLK